MSTSPAAAGRNSSNVTLARTSSRMDDVTTPMRPVSTDGTLRRGASGDDVVSLQAALNRAGARPPLVEDGKLGPKTEAAVRAFQSSRGLTVDGVVGAETRGALAVDTGDGPSRATSKTTGSRDGAPVREPAMPGGDVDVGSIYGTDEDGGSFAARVTARAEQDVGRVQPQERGANGGYKGWDYLQETFTKTTGWTPKTSDIKSDSTPQDKHWCGIWATRMYQEAGVDVKWDLTKGKPVGDVAYAQRPWRREQAEAFRASVQPGDIVTVDGKYNHHALVVGVNADGTIDTIDGNKPHIGRAHYDLAKVNGYYRPTPPG